MWQLTDESALIARWRKLAAAWSAEIAVTLQEPLRSQIVLARKAYLQCAQELEAVEAKRRTHIERASRTRSA